MTETGSALDEILSRIRQTIHPDRVILFGSRARGDDQEGSDFDILIIAPSSLPRWRRVMPLYQLLAGLGVPKDVLWWTPEEAAEWSGVRSHFITRALCEGKVVYEKPA